MSSFTPRYGWLAAAAALVFVSACSAHQSSLPAIPVLSSGIQRVPTPQPQITPTRQTHSVSVQQGRAPSHPVTAPHPTNAAGDTHPGVRPSLVRALVQITDLDAAAPQAGYDPYHDALRIVNGSRLRISVRDATIVSGSIRAGTSQAQLTSDGNGRWSATLRFIDTSNPPNPHPAVVVTLTKNGAVSTQSFTLAEMHE